MNGFMDKREKIHLLVLNHLNLSPILWISLFLLYQTLIPDQLYPISQVKV